ncbi:hypothetical protein BGZ88_001564, partial [Linnemannia elongata]
MDTKPLTLFCLVDGEATTNAFPVEIESTKTIGDLKELIKTEKTNDFSDFDAEKLTLTRLSKLFPESSDDNMYILVQRPPPDKKWRELVVQIEDDFFAPDSDNHKRLDRFLKAEKLISATGGVLGGLPFVSRRAGSTKDRPSLLFLGLLETSATQDTPSTADRVLERIHGQSIPLLPLFGVSGCGKTRTAIEMLSKNWGFYFNASSTDWGSNDLLCFLELVQQKKRHKHGDPMSNAHVHVLALGLVLARVIILHHCLKIAEREGTTFTCKRWMLLQVGCCTMSVGDLSSMLFTSIADAIHGHSIIITNMRILVRDRFSSLRQRFPSLTSDTPFQSFDYKILLVIDEAQNLGRQETPSKAERHARTGSFDDYKRPIFSALVHGLYQIAADRNQFCVIPCGTGLSILDIDWLEDSAPGPKGDNKLLGPFTDFQGWRSLEQVRSYRDLVRCSLPSEKARVIFDTRLPDTSMAELFARLRGRFRPIVSAIERMIMPDNDRIDWRLAIEETERTLTSTDLEDCVKGNIPYDISRMITRVANPNH